MNFNFDCVAEKITDNIYIIDTFYLNREKFAASYIIEDNGEVAIIETNTNHAVPRILNALKNCGFDRSQVKYVVLSHIHLDHAGGAGLLMKELPEAELIVHPRGARHMISPERLIESVKHVYGDEEYNNLYGEIIGIPENRVKSITGGDCLCLGDRKLSIIEATGHAKHHNVIYDPLSGSLFSGDAFGIGYPRFRYSKGDLIFPSTSPVQFDPESAVETFNMILDLSPVRILLTHYGSIESVDRVFTQLNEWIDYTENSAVTGYSNGFRDEDLEKAVSKDIWKKFEDRIIEIRGEVLSEEEKDHLFIDAELNGKGAASHISRKNM